jgi:hypothetical protein
LKKFILILLLLPSVSYAFDEWTKTNIVLGTTATIVHVLDWGQTLDMVNRSNEFHEDNFITKRIIGEHPSRSEVNVFMASTLLLKLGIAHVLPAKWRNYFLGVSIIWQGQTVYNNYRIGLKIDF